MKYSELRAAFCQYEENRPEQHLTAIIVFSEDSFDRRYPRLSRSYITSSNNKAYQPNIRMTTRPSSCSRICRPPLRTWLPMAAC